MLRSILKAGYKVLRVHTALAVKDLPLLLIATTLFKQSTAAVIWIHEDIKCLSCSLPNALWQFKRSDAIERARMLKCSLDATYPCHTYAKCYYHSRLKLPLRDTIQRQINTKRRRTHHPRVCRVRARVWVRHWCKCGWWCE